MVSLAAGLASVASAGAQVDKWCRQASVGRSLVDKLSR